MYVALRKESVDRNTQRRDFKRLCLVACILTILICTVSLSARRAWIEIIDYIIDYATDAVALRKESVDRNCIIVMVGLLMFVALRKESVDRNSL